MVSPIKDICIFMITVQAVMYFAPGGSYEKYIKILIGILMILRITEPVLGFFMDGEAKMEIQRRAMALQEELKVREWEVELEGQRLEVYSSIEEELKEELEKEQDQGKR